jgi:C4-dicarboxylate-specific signal transduction histidine kinase
VRLQDGQIERPGHTATIEIDRDIAAYLVGPQVVGDRIQLQQVLLNLITNAIESMADEDGPRILKMTHKSRSFGNR